MRGKVSATNLLARLFSNKDTLVFLGGIFFAFLGTLSDWSLLNSANDLIFFPLTPTNLIQASTWQHFFHQIPGHNFLELEIPQRIFSFFSTLFYFIWGKIFGISKGFIILKTILGALSYFIFYKIFRIHLSRRWSVILASLALSGVSSHSFRSYLGSIFSGAEQLALSPLEIFQQPFPSLSMFLFSLCVLLSLKERLSLRRSFFLSVMWGIQTHVHIYSFIVGVPFFLFQLKTNYLDNRQSKRKAFALVIGIISFFFLTWIIPAISLILTTIEISEQLGLTRNRDIVAITNSFYALAYFVLPLVLMGIVFLVKKIDPYEIFKRFGYIFVLMSVEFLIILISGFFFGNVQINHWFSRMFIFIHFFYLVPGIYYLSRINILSFSFGTEAHPVAKRLEKNVKNFLTFFEYNIIPIVFILLLLFILRSNFLQKDIREKMVNQHSDEIQRLQSEINSLPRGFFISTNNLLFNIYLMNNFPDKSLWVNGSFENLPIDKVIDRFVLFGRLARYTPKEFMNFMDGKFMEMNFNLQIDSTEITKSGIGGFLGYHQFRFFGYYLGSLGEKILLDKFNNSELKELSSKIKFIRF